MTAGRISFIGVTTASSTMMRLFPVWADRLGLDGATIAGVDLPIGAAPERYREVVATIKEDAAEAGALITTHKLDLFRACRDLFDWVDPHAAQLAECSCLSKREGVLRAHATDAVTAGLALDDVAPGGHFAATGADALCLGAGGAGLAITLNLLAREPAEDRPRRILVCDRSAERLAGMERLHAGLRDHGVEVRYVRGEGPQVDASLLGGLAPGSLVVNATGMGKDAPGSPLPAGARLPERGLVWELNYRGELDFLHQARAQAADRELQVHDGWRYFILGWSAVITEIYGLDLDDHALADLTELAAPLRG